MFSVTRSGLSVTDSRVFGDKCLKNARVFGDKMSRVTVYTVGETRVNGDAWARVFGDATNPWIACPKRSGAPSPFGALRF